jgi:hypothetical protein
MILQPHIFRATKGYHTIRVAYFLANPPGFDLDMAPLTKASLA